MPDVGSKECKITEKFLYFPLLFFTISSAIGAEKSDRAKFFSLAFSPIAVAQSILLFPSCNSVAVHFRDKILFGAFVVPSIRPSVLTILNHTQNVYQTYIQNIYKKKLRLQFQFQIKRYINTMIKNIVKIHFKWTVQL